MCDNCGCGNKGEKAVIRVPGEEHYHSHGHHHDSNHHHHHHSGADHVHEHDHHKGMKKIIPVGTDILQANNLLAERNRGMFEAKNISVINLMSSPGSGKTTLLERTINDLKNIIDFYVIEGDQQTMNDAQRIKATGVPVVQVNTGNGCHLDAEMINRAVKILAPANDSVIMIENVGNLVCPSLFDLGETFKVVVLSVTEGEDKPLKYQNMFSSASLCVLNKVDLLPYLDYDIEKTISYGKQVNRDMHFINLSAKTREGIEDWYDWLKKNAPEKGIKK